ncbi:CDGSH iron-sulfur domain-containing protein [Actinomycetota bacterium Odt1-20B]
MPNAASEPNPPGRASPSGPSPSPRPGQPSRPGREATRITARRQGPLLVEGPIEITLDDGTTVTSDRFLVAVCTCRRSRRYPWCDASHRRVRRE